VENIKTELNFLKAQLQPHFCLIRWIISIPWHWTIASWRESNPAIIGFIKVYDLRIGNRKGRSGKRDQPLAGLELEKYDLHPGWNFRSIFPATFPLRK
jgi:hypothetical protein